MVPGYGKQNKTKHKQSKGHGQKPQKIAREACQGLNVTDPQ